MGMFTEEEKDIMKHNIELQKQVLAEITRREAQELAK